MNKLTFIFFLSISSVLHAQVLPEARKTIETLTSKVMWGRGYTKDGMLKAADYICDELKKAGVKPMAADRFKQNFSYPANTFPGKMEVRINGNKLIPGKDFIIDPASSGQKNTNLHLVQTDSVTFISRPQKLLLSLKNKLTWSVAQKAGDYTVLQLDRKSISGNPKTVDLNIEHVFVPEFKTSNIGGIIRGSRMPDSLLLITAHYDHLGGMGNNTYFPGANDNASGISMLLSLAKYYGENPPPYSIGLICFAGEEAGLLGSAYFIEHPLVPLDKIKFLINIDMVGTGEKGITVVNATLHPKEFALLNQINDKKIYLPIINPRGKAANSDHYYFTEKGIPAFFIYTQGGISAYHDVYDKPATLPLTEFAHLRQLLIDFNAQLMK